MEAPVTNQGFDLGPQYGGDDSFTARMRLHQSWYRAVVLQTPFGNGPRPNSTRKYGNMLDAAGEDRGLNFLDSGIREVVNARLAEDVGVVERFRLLRNMLSSQPMCFNLFGRMAVDIADGDGITTRLWRAVLGDEVRRVTRVAFEVAPLPKGEYLGDRTAFDAYVEYEHAAGGRAFLGIETKLTEPFSQRPSKPRDGDSLYRRWTEVENAPWRPGAFESFREIAHHQLFRDHLLAVAMSRHPTGAFVAGRLMLIRHDQDTKCAQAVSGYETLLRRGHDSFVDMPLGRLFDIWSSVGLPKSWHAWEQAFRLRYLNLAGSEKL